VVQLGTTVLFVDGYAFFVPVGPGGVTTGGTYYFQTADCSDQPLAPESVAAGIFVVPASLRADGTLTYVAPGSGQPQPVLASQSLSASGTPGPCAAAKPGTVISVGPIVTTVIQPFTPPIHVEGS
jgi:hypothetical protein